MALIEVFANRRVCHSASFIGPLERKPCALPFILKPSLQFIPEAISTLDVKDNEIVQSYRILISVLTYYEIVSGLKHRDARKQLDFFLNFCEFVSIIPVTEGSARKSAEIYASLRSRGKLLMMSIF